MSRVLGFLGKVFIPPSFSLFSKKQDTPTEEEDTQSLDDKLASQAEREPEDEARGGTQEPLDTPEQTWFPKLPAKEESPEQSPLPETPSKSAGARPALPKAPREAIETRATEQTWEDTAALTDQPLQPPAETVVPFGTPGLDLGINTQSTLPEGMSEEESQSLDIERKLDREPETPESAIELSKPSPAISTPQVFPEERKPLVTEDIVESAVEAETQPPSERGRPQRGMSLKARTAKWEEKHAAWEEAGSEEPEPERPGRAAPDYEPGAGRFAQEGGAAPPSQEAAAPKGEEDVAGAIAEGNKITQELLMAVNAMTQQVTEAVAMLTEIRSALSEEQGIYPRG